jgi:hypothetical protein
VSLLSSSGNYLIYSTYLGGNNYDYGLEIAIDGSGSAYVTGYTFSTDFPMQNPYQIDQPNYDAFVTKFNPSVCQYIPGDINGDGLANGNDIVYANNYFKGSGPPPPIDCNPPCLYQVDPFYAAGDVNGNCLFNGIDITYYVRYLQGQVPSLLYCPDCPPAQ